MLPSPDHRASHHEIRGETIDRGLSRFGQLQQSGENDVAHRESYLPASNRSALSLALTRAWFSDVLIAETVLPKASRSLLLFLAATMDLMQRHLLPPLVSIWRISSRG